MMQWHQHSRPKQTQSQLLGRTPPASAGAVMVACCRSTGLH